MEILFLFAIVVGGVILIGSICGLMAISRLGTLTGDIERISRRLGRVERRLGDLGPEPETKAEETQAPQAIPAPPPLPERPQEGPEYVAAPPAKEAVPLPKETTAPAKDTAPPAAAAHVARQTPKAPAPPKETAWKPSDIEFQLGTRWIIWVGAAIFLGGVALGLKYAVDNSLLGPTGRLLTGVFTGFVFLGAGQYYNHKEWRIPFQAFSGAGLAIFYICIFFAFELYGLIGQTTAMGLAVGVTGFAIGLSVLHDALGIAFLAVAGGYLSPLFLSTGENRPYVLFTYVAVLNIVAFGATYFRRWRALDVFCLVASVLLFHGWFEKFYAYPDQLAPALLFATVFYLMFLLIPAGYSLVRRTAPTIEGVLLILGSSLYWLLAYYEILHGPHRRILGFVILAQAALVFILYLLWQKRLREPSPATESLIIVALALLLLDVPVQLSLYALPAGWAIEGVVLVCLGLRFRRFLPRLAGAGALGLAAVALFARLPLHTEVFSPILNVPFGSWTAVILSAAVMAVLLYRFLGRDSIGRAYWIAGPALLGLFLTCVLLSLETSLYWRIPQEQGWMAKEARALVVLWAFIPFVVTLAAKRAKRLPFTLAACAVHIVGTAFFLWSIFAYASESTTLVFNPAFLPRLLFITGLWFSAYALPRVDRENVGWVLEVIGHALLALLAFYELRRWGMASTWIAQDSAIALVSMVWALQGAVLVWRGLLTRHLFRRCAGFGLSAMAAAGLFKHMPLHSEAFTPVFNPPFATWTVVILSAAAMAMLLHTYLKRSDKERGYWIAAPAYAGLLLACLLLTLETSLYWRIPEEVGWVAKEARALAVLWAFIPLAVTLAAHRAKHRVFTLTAWAIQLVGTVFFLWSFHAYTSGSGVLAFNAAFLPRLLFIAGLWFSAYALPRIDDKDFDWGLEVLGQALLAFLAFHELRRWGLESTWISEDMAIGLVSAVWALQGCALVWHGLVTRHAFRRYAGFALFALAVAKTVLVDTWNLAEVYRIVSWLACGGLLVAAALLYHRFSPLLLEELAKEKRDRP